jgi:arsenate reductase (glutaredoxin)
MEQITVYEKPTCTTCRKVSKLLKENNIDFEKVNYYIEPLSKEKLKLLLKKMKIKPEELLRKNEAAYKEIDLQNNPLSENELIELMINNPDLIQRPIIEMGDRAILARPPEKINEFFGEHS